MPTPNLPPGFDFTDPDIYAERLPVEELAEMRKVAPIWWQNQTRGNLAFGDDGYWVVTKHKDVKEVSRRSDVFSSNKKTALPRYRDEAEPESLEGGKVVLLNQDAPHHTHLREMILRRWVWCGASMLSSTNLPVSIWSPVEPSGYRGSAVFSRLEKTSLRLEISLTSLCLVTTQ